ncbi:MAG: hypothetical protein M3Q71_07605 [Chloroflexota bacterium]|nr:hypothetical protein [Chloroflexota bacterium]
MGTRPCDYYHLFEQPKILWPDIAKLPRFSWDECGMFINDTGFFLPTEDLSLLALLQSRVLWFIISQMSQPLRLRGGLWQYRLKTQFIERLPIPAVSPSERDALADLARTITDCAGMRDNFHSGVRHRVSIDLSCSEAKLNQKLTAWWTLDFAAFRGEVQKALKREIPVRERDEWAAWLQERREEHEQLTAEMVRLETELNARVYELFDLSPAEITIIAESTKYRYGEV